MRTLRAYCFIGDGAIRCLGDVEVDTDEDTLVAELFIAEISDRELVRQRRRGRICFGSRIH